MKKLLSVILAALLCISLAACGADEAPAPTPATQPEKQGSSAADTGSPIEMLNAAQICETMDEYAKDAEDCIAPVIECLNSIKNYSGLQQDYVITETMGAALDAKDAIRSIYDNSKAILDLTECQDGLGDYFDSLTDVLGSALTFADKVKEFCKDPSMEKAEDYEHYFNVYLASKLNYAEAQMEYLGNYYTEEEVLEFLE